MHNRNKNVYYLLFLSTYVKAKINIHTRKKITFVPLDTVLAKSQCGIRWLKLQHF